MDANEHEFKPHSACCRFLNVGHQRPSRFRGKVTTRNRPIRVYSRAIAVKHHRLKSSHLAGGDGAEVVFGADLSAFEIHFDPIDRRARREGATQRGTRRERCDHLDGLDA